jgi:hypothetical protein
MRISKVFALILALSFISFLTAYAQDADAVRILDGAAAEYYLPAVSLVRPGVLL